MTRYGRTVWFLTLAGVGLLTATALGADERVPLRPPVKGEETPVCDTDGPTDAEVIRAMNAYDRKVAEKARNDPEFRITRELIVSKLGPARFYPLVGFARLHHYHWKCTVSFTDRFEVVYPFPAKQEKDRTVVVYIDEDHLHRHDLPGDAPAKPTPAAELPGVPPEFALVPEDATAFVTAKAGKLLETLNYRNKVHLLPELDQLVTTIGLPMSGADRMTVVAAKFSKEWGGFAAVIVTFDDKLDRAGILRRQWADAKKVTHHGKAYHLGKGSNVSICFVNDRTAVVATSEEAMKACLKSRKPVDERNDAVAGQLKLAADHDVYGWVDGDELRAAVGEGSLLPLGIESAAVSLDVNDRLDLRVRVSCADADTAAWSRKALEALVNSARLQLLLGIVVTADPALFGTGAGGIVGAGEHAQLPLKLVRLAEKGLQSTRFKVAGTEASLEATVPIDNKTLRAEFRGVLRMLNGDSAVTEKGALGGGAGTLIGAATGNPKTGAVVGGLIGAGTGALVGNEADQKYQPPVNSKDYRPLGTPVESVPPPAPQVIRQAGTGPIKVTVANVRKVPVRVYECIDDGKLRLVGKVAAGDAVDLKLMSQTRHVAVFVETPDADPVLEAFTPATADTVWLIRP